MSRTYWTSSGPSRSPVETLLTGAGCPGRTGPALDPPGPRWRLYSLELNVLDVLDQLRTLPVPGGDSTHWSWMSRTYWTSSGPSRSPVETLLTGAGCPGRIGPAQDPPGPRWRLYSLELDVLDVLDQLRTLPVPSGDSTHWS